MALAFEKKGQGHLPYQERQQQWEDQQLQQGGQQERK